MWYGNIGVIYWNKTETLLYVFAIANSSCPNWPAKGVSCKLCWQKMFPLIYVTTQNWMKNGKRLTIDCQFHLPWCGHVYDPLPPVGSVAALHRSDRFLFYVSSFLISPFVVAKPCNSICWVMFGKTLMLCPAPSSSCWIFFACFPCHSQLCSANLNQSVPCLSALHVTNNYSLRLAGSLYLRRYWNGPIERM